MTQLEKAKLKYKNSKNNQIVYNGKTFRDFLVECYLNYSPASYGKYIQKKLETELSDKYIYLLRNEEKNNCGDLRFEFPNPYYLDFKHENKLYYELDTPASFKPITKNWEFKVSYLGKNSHYTIRNLRPYQELNGGYLLCFVDCENDFKEEFYLVDYWVFQRFFTLTHMNGTKDKHYGDGFENYGLTLKKGSEQHYILKRYNSLKGTELSDVISYFENLKMEIREEFCKTEECKKFVGELLESVAEVRVNFLPDFLKKDDFKETLDNLIKQIKSEYNKVVDIKSTYYGFNSSQLLFSVKDRIAGWDYVDEITEKYSNYFSRVFKSSERY